LILVNLIVLLVCISLSSCNSKASSLTVDYERGQISEGSDVYGIFYSYVPISITEKSEILVLIHGTPKDLSPEENAEFYISRWKDFVEKNSNILIAPAFNQDNFSSRYGDRAMSGYRGLFGKEIGADEWVIRLVESEYKSSCRTSGLSRIWNHFIKRSK